MGITDSILLWRICYQFDFSTIVTALRSCDGQVIQTGVTQFLGNRFCSHKERSLMVEKFTPLMHSLPLRWLIRNSSHNHFSSSPVLWQKITESILHGYAVASSPFSHSQEQLIHCLVSKRMVNLLKMKIVLHVEAKGRKPFPISEMPHENET